MISSLFGAELLGDKTTWEVIFEYFGAINALQRYRWERVAVVRVTVVGVFIGRFLWVESLELAIAPLNAVAVEKSGAST